MTAGSEAKGFHDSVTAWLQSRGFDAAEVSDVYGEGTDWHGSTSDGYDENFSVQIRYLTRGGRTEHLGVGGEDMGSLWEWVVGSWPAAGGDDRGQGAQGGETERRYVWHEGRRYVDINFEPEEVRRAAFPPRNPHTQA